MRPIAVWIAASSLGLMTACAGGSRTASDEGPCAGLSDAEVDGAVEDLRPNVGGVEARYEGSPKQVPRTVGAVLQVRAARGTSAPWLARVLQCHEARHASGSPCRSHESCPLALPGAETEVVPTPTGFAVTIRSRDLDVAHEIGRRAQALARPAPASSHVVER